MSDLDEAYEQLCQRFAAGMDLPVERVHLSPTPDPCAARTRAHRRWRRFWLVYASAAFTTGVVADTVAQTRDGYPATLTCALRAWAGLDPWARHGHVGRVAVAAFLLWSCVHLVTGRLGPTKGKVTA